MTKRLSHRLLSLSGALALPGVLLFAVSVQTHDTAAARQPTSTNRALFVIGKAGDNLWPLSVTIYTNGAVKGFWTINSRGGKARPRVQLSRPALDGLMTLARAEKFFSMPVRIGSGTASAPTRFITIRSGTITRTVSGRGVIRSAAFNQLYAVLLVASGVPCYPDRQCGV